MSAHLFASWIGHPRFAHAGLLLCALLALPVWWWSRRSSGRLVFSSFRALPLGRSARAQLAWIPDALFALAVVAFAIAATGPRVRDEDTPIRRDGIAVMMAIDISGSMRALDLSEKNQELTRLDAVKRVFEQFVLGGDGLGGRGNDAIGLIAFAHYADTRSPLTLDHDNLVAAARALDNAPREEDGTAIGAGLELAVQRLIDAKNAKSKVVILLTDGESNIHDIDEQTAIDDAVKAGVRVYTIGAGTTGVAHIRVDRGDGRSQLVPIDASIDEALLRKIAEKTGGQYFRATDNASLHRIYGQIDKLERTQFDEERLAHYAYLFQLFVAGALVLAVVGFALRSTVFRRLP